MTNIQLSDTEAKLFLSFKEHQDVFEHLVKSNVFKVRNGKATLNFDSEGTLTEVSIDFKAYKRGVITIVSLR